MLPHFSDLLQRIKSVVPSESLGVIYEMESDIATAYQNKVIDTLGLTKLSEEHVAELNAAIKNRGRFLYYHRTTDDFNETMNLFWGDMKDPRNIKLRIAYTSVCGGTGLSSKTEYLDEYWRDYVEVRDLSLYLTIDAHRQINDVINDKIGYYPEPNMDELWVELFEVLDSILFIKPGISWDVADTAARRVDKRTFTSNRLYPTDRFDTTWFTAWTKNTKPEINVGDVVFIRPEFNHGDVAYFTVTPFDDHVFMKLKNGEWATHVPKDKFNGYYLENVVAYYKEILSHLQ